MINVINMFNCYSYSLLLIRNNFIRVGKYGLSMSRTTYGPVMYSYCGRLVLLHSNLLSSTCQANNKESEALSKHSSTYSKILRNI